MLTGRLKELWRNKRRETIAGGTVLLLAIISLAVNLDGISGNTAQVTSGISSSRTELQRKQELLTQAVREEQLLRTPIWKLAGMRRKFWRPEDGKPQNELRRRLEQCAKSAGLRLKTIGAMQTIKVVEGLNSHSINLTADCQLNELADFLWNIDREQPEISWMNITIQPDNTRSPNHLVLNGSIRILMLEMPDAARKIWSE